MTTVRNPYRWDVVDPALFYGRDELRHQLVERLLTGDRFAVAGGRRMGKTTLLRRVEADLLARGTGGLIVLPVFIDAAELYGGSADAAWTLLGRRVGETASAGGLAADLPAVATGADLADALRAVLHAARRRGRVQLVFLFDEIERVLGAAWGGPFLAYWRMLLNNMGELSRHVGAVFAGTASIYRIAQDAGSPLGNILAWQELELLSREATARLAREPSGYAWPDALVTRVFELSGGQPCLSQYLMQRVCEHDATAWRAALADAEQRFPREHASIFAGWWQGFDATARAAYALLAARGVLPEGELIGRFAGAGKRALDVLAHTGVVRWDHDARTVAAAGAMFQSWAERNALASDGASPQAEAAVVAAAGGPIRSERRIGTVLFTDIVSSTRLTARLGDRRWLQLVSDHNALVREALAAFRGRELNTMGDGFLALFDAPAAAIQCACAIAKAVRPLGLEVRAGLHAGEFQLAGDEVIGITVNYAAWVMSRARGGEVLVSETVRALVAGSGIRFVRRGPFKVKGSDERHRVYRVDGSSGPVALPLP